MLPVANLIHVSDVEAALRWYQLAFPRAKLRDIDGFVCLDVDGFLLELVAADEKVCSGKAGSVTYWGVTDLDSEILRFKALGADVYRGPMDMGDGMGMCQVTDPFGNLIGFRGPFSGGG